MHTLYNTAWANKSNAEKKFKMLLMMFAKWNKISIWTIENFSLLKKMKFESFRRAKKKNSVVVKPIVFVSSVGNFGIYTKTRKIK